MSNQEIIHAYRHLYRGLLHAVQFSNRARFTARDQLRRAFRDKNGTFDAEGVKRTRWFLDAATKERGLEHKILKNLVRMAAERNKTTTWRLHTRKLQHGAKNTSTLNAATKATSNAYRHYDMTVAMLNKSMGLCLR